MGQLEQTDKVKKNVAYPITIDGRHFWSWFAARLPPHQNVALDHAAVVQRSNCLLIFFGQLLSVYWSSGAFVVPVSVVMSWRSVNEKKLKKHNRSDH